MSLRHMHHCMSMNALEQGLLGLEAAKASDINVCVKKDHKCFVPSVLSCLS